MALTPAPWDFPRPMETAAILVAVGQERGLPVQDCLAGTGLDATRLGEPSARISAAQELQIIRNLLRQLGPDVPLGLEAGRRYQASTFGIWGFAVLNARTMREAVEVGVRFARLTAAWCAPRIEDRGAEALMVVKTEGLPQDVSQFLLERDAAILIALQRSMVPVHLPFTSVTCTFPRPSYHRLVDDYFGAPVAYDQAENAIAVPASLGNMPVPDHNSLFFERCHQECERLLDEQTRYAGLAGRVRSILMRQLHQSPTMAQISDELGVSARTLRRHLAREGIEFEILLEETRQTLAEQLLRTTDFSINEIADQLGYRHTTNFVRAFSRWRGTSPLSWKRGRTRSPGRQARN